jgi:hypothetical protein
MVEMIEGESPLSIEQETTTSIISRLRSRMARLQVMVDDDASTLISSISASTTPEAMELRDIYNKSWFSRCLYSLPTQAKIAFALLDATAAYPTVDNELWQSIVMRTAK